MLNAYPYLEGIITDRPKPVHTAPFQPSPKMSLSQSVQLAFTPTDTSPVNGAPASSGGVPEHASCQLISDGKCPSETLMGFTTAPSSVGRMSVVALAGTTQSPVYVHAGGFHPVHAIEHG